MSAISVIIVSWNARDYLWNCLRSVRETGASVVREIIVVDNASTDGSAEMVTAEFPEVTLIRAAKNLGFARANNLGLQRASGEQLALVNSDVVLHPNCLQQLSSFLEAHQDTGLVGPKILGGDGQWQPTCRRQPTVWNTLCRTLALDTFMGRWALFAGREMLKPNHDQPVNVEVLSGCFWLARRAAVEQVGGLDEQFFFYAEDVDWCHRFTDAGWRIWYVPQATATHFGGGSSANAPMCYSIEMVRSNLIYWKKYYGSIGKFFYYWLSILYHTLRLVPRGLALLCGMAVLGGENKFRQHLVCLRWLLTGKACDYK